VARRATKITDERKSGSPLLVLDAGNSLTGDRDPALQSAGASSVEAMNLLGYDAVALGPKDLALGTAALRQRIAEASFSFLSANAVDRSTGELLAKPYAVRDVGGYRVAIIGISGLGDTEQISVRDPLAAVRAAVADAEVESDVIVVLSNAGAEVNQRIADGVTGIAAIIGGGTGASAEPWVSSRTNTPVFHADEGSPGHAGRVLGVARLVVDRNDTLTDYTWKPLKLGPEVPDDAAVAMWLKTKTGS